MYIFLYKYIFIEKYFLTAFQHQQLNTEQGTNIIIKTFRFKNYWLQFYIISNITIYNKK